MVDFDLSPDEQTIAFTGDDGRRRDVYAMPTRGGKATKLTDGVHDYQPTWSPRGDLIAFVRDSLPDRDRHVYTMRADGSRQRNVSGRADDEFPHWIP